MARFINQETGQVIDGQPVSLTELLRAYRVEIERQTGMPIEQIEINAAVILYDLCFSIGIENRARVLGENAVMFCELADGLPGSPLLN